MSEEIAHSSDNIIVIKDLLKEYSFNKQVLTAVCIPSLKIKKGLFTGLVGSDGAGKTTLLRMIAGLMPVTSGKILIDETDPSTKNSKLHKILSYMPQQFGLYEDLTVIENLNLYADLRGLNYVNRKQKIEYLLDVTKLNKFADRLTGALSGGMKQKLSLASVILGDPEILLLDEPSVGVDPVSRKELWDIVKKLVSNGMSVVWATSYFYEAESCDDVVVIDEGKVIYSGNPQKIISTMPGRCISLNVIDSNNKRNILQQTLKIPCVMDGVIQGDSVRLLLQKKENITNFEVFEGVSSTVLVNPCFQDVFVDLIGGFPKKDDNPINLKNINNSGEKLDYTIEVNNLTKTFGSFKAVDDISFKVKAGEIFCLLGPNGAGKSTTFKMMCGLLSPTSGDASILGIDLQKNPYLARQNIGYMAQKFSLFRDLTVEQNLEFFSGIYGLSYKQSKIKIAEMLDTFDLEQYKKTKTENIPLGFKQRLSLACAIIHEPSILFLDEPTSGVDLFARRDFWRRINELAQNKITIIVTTHFMEEAEFSDRISFIASGKVIASGSPDQLKNLVKNEKLPNPTMEDAFFNLTSNYEKEKNSSDLVKANILKSSNYNIEQYIKISASLKRLLALSKKEFHQIIRDPSYIVIAFILPIVMLFLYGYGINLDSSKIRLGVIMNSISSDAQSLKQSFDKSSYIDAITLSNVNDAKKEITTGNIKGFVNIQSDFIKNLKEQKSPANMQIVTDGSEPNTAKFVNIYSNGIFNEWLSSLHLNLDRSLTPKINIDSYVWYNSAAISRYFLVPGSISIIMTVIGAILTSLVVAREWERGTMELLLSTSISKMEFILSKLIPYYFLGIIAMALCTFLAITVLNVPFRGSYFILFVETTLFLGGALGLGLLISTAIHNQLGAAQMALNLAYFPAVMFSGYAFEIKSMPSAIQALTYAFPARYLVSCLQTLFLAGTAPMFLIKNGAFLLLNAMIFLLLTYKLTKQKLY
ncbi:ATP-binding cassette domain-containing protein [Gammaproteobacteria bacterium]|nr:ATP-binding cassette domain-containing protein [Gammaproteobacteria bacterium]